MAAAETPQEIRRRRIEKKEAKGRRRREKDGWDKDYLVSWCRVEVIQPPSAAALLGFGSGFLILVK